MPARSVSGPALRGPGRTRIGRSAYVARTLAATGIVRPYAPSAVVALTKNLVTWGTGPAGGFASLASLDPDGAAVIDRRGSVTFAQVHRRSNALARGLAELGVAADDSVAVLCRNHREFVEATIAIGRLGAHVLYLNTGFAAPQLRDLLARERPVAIVYDLDFAEVVASVPAQVRRVVADVDPDRDHELDLPTIDSLTAAHDDGDLSAPAIEGRSVILTSGTTGTPKAASRGPGSLTSAAALLSRIPLRRGWTTHIAAPMFHTWGWTHLNLAMMLGSTIVLTGRFEPRSFLEAMDEHACDAAAVVPVMLQRVLELPAEVLDSYALHSAKVVAASGSSLPGDLATRWMDRFGDTLFNTYGSTECAWATIAVPADLREHPGTSGAPPLGTSVVLLDDDGTPAPAGETGRIFVANGAQFEGYTDGDGKEVRDEHMSTGDVGRIEDGLLFVDGRDDDMIVSGGENVYPHEVEECLVRHPAVLEATAVGVPDPDFGQRLVAYVALHEGATAAEADLKEFVRSHLARYKVPRDVRFVRELPRNATGKVVKRDLPPS